MDWLQREGEPPQWFARFERYLMLGERRTLEAVWRDEQQRLGGAKGRTGKQASRPNRHWYDAAKQWQWTARAVAYDQMQRDLEKAEWEAKRHKARKRRLDLLDAFAMPIVQAMAGFDPKAAKPYDLAQLFKIFMEQSRLEYDDLPTNRVDVTSNGQELKGLTADRYADIRAQARAEVGAFEAGFLVKANGNGHGNHA